MHNVQTRCCSITLIMTSDESRSTIGILIEVLLVNCSVYSLVLFGVLYQAGMLQRHREREERG